MDFADLTRYLWLALLWILYCVVHSALISYTVSDYFRRVLGNGFRFYRLCFNLFSIITLVLLVLYSSSFRTLPLFSWRGYGRILQLVLIAFAVVLLIAGARRYSLRGFLGLQQISDGRATGAMADSVHFERTGVFGVIRHPWYAAVFVLLWTRDMDISTVIVNLILSGYLLIGTYLEERKLVREFGVEYRRYQDDVSMLFPFKWISTRCAGGADNP